LAVAGNAFEPVTPALVAFIASTACSPNSLSSSTRRSAAVTAAGAACIACVECMGAFSVRLDAATAAATSTPVTPTAASAAVIERWDALARRALWEDLHGEHRALAAEVLRDGARADPLAYWLERHARPVGRWLQVLADPKAAPSSDLATLSVREIRNLIDATAHAPDAARPAAEIH
jgi:hypothetical protein